jgi:hypothetical protein
MGERRLMGSILHITSHLNAERTYLTPEAVFHRIERGEPVPLGEPSEQRWAVPHAITVVERDEEPDRRWPSAWPEEDGGNAPLAPQRDRSVLRRAPVAQ